MKLKKEDFRGTGMVFSFTLSQFFKSKANKITLAVMFVLMLVSFPVVSLLSSDTMIQESTELEMEASDTEQAEAGKAAEAELTTVYYLNETGYDIDFSEIGNRMNHLAGTAFTEAAFAAEDYAQELAQDEALITVTAGMSGIQIGIYCQAKADHEELYEDLQIVCTDLITEARYASVGATSEQMAAAFAGVETNTQTYSEYQDDTGVGFESAFAVQYIYSILVLILTTFSTTYIVHAVVEEKASKLIETLMVSVRPLALIVGKILAVMAYVFGMILMMLAAGVISYFIARQFTGMVPIGEVLGAFGIAADGIHLGVSTILISFFSLLLGYLTFSIIGGLAGTGCSFMEDMESANSTVVLLVMAGYLTSSFTTGFASKTVGMVTSLVPIVSVFSAPVQYVFGNINFLTLCISWLIQIVIIAVLAFFCARIYDALLMHRGRKLKLSDMIGLARGKVIKEEV